MHIKIAAAFLALMSLLTDAQACVAQKNFDESGSQLTIRDPSVSYADDDGRRSVTTFATIENTSSSCVENIFVEVKYFDKNKNLVDVINQNLGLLTLPPGQEAAFRVRDRADKARAAYATSTVRVLSVDQKVTSPPSPKSKEEDSLFVSILAGWGPMVLLIGVWLLGMRRLTGKKSAQERQTVALDRIARAAEKSAQISAPL